MSQREFPPVHESVIDLVWQDVRKRLSVDLPAGLSALVDDVTRVVCEYTPTVLASLTGYAYLRKAIAQTI